MLDLPRRVLRGDVRLRAETRRRSQCTRSGSEISFPLHAELLESLAVYPHLRVLASCLRLVDGYAQICMRSMPWTGQAQKALAKVPGQACSQSPVRKPRSSTSCYTHASSRGPAYTACTQSLVSQGAYNYLPQSTKQVGQKVPARVGTRVQVKAADDRTREERMLRSRRAYLIEDATKHGFIREPWHRSKQPSKPHLPRATHRHTRQDSKAHSSHQTHLRGNTLQGTWNRQCSDGAERNATATKAGFIAYRDAPHPHAEHPSQLCCQITCSCTER